MAELATLVRLARRDGFHNELSQEELEKRLGVLQRGTLKLMEEANCRVRTPNAILNPRIDADWKELREGFEDAARESRHLQEKHFGPKKREKALSGEHVGQQVPPRLHCRNQRLQD